MPCATPSNRCAEEKRAQLAEEKKRVHARYCLQRSATPPVLGYILADYWLILAQVVCDKDYVKGWMRTGVCHVHVMFLGETFLGPRRFTRAGTH